MTPAYAECMLFNFYCDAYSAIFAVFTTLEYFICESFTPLFVVSLKKTSIISIEYFIRLFVSFPGFLKRFFLVNDVSR